MKNSAKWETSKALIDRRQINKMIINTRPLCSTRFVSENPERITCNPNNMNVGKRYPISASTKTTNKEQRIPKLRENTITSPALLAASTAAAKKSSSAEPENTKIPSKNHYGECAWSWRRNMKGILPFCAIDCFLVVKTGWRDQENKWLEIGIITASLLENKKRIHISINKEKKIREKF